MKTSTPIRALLFATSAVAQSFISRASSASASVVAAAATSIVTSTAGSLPAAGSNGCAEGYYPGTDTVIDAVPYTYHEVLSIIGNYTNLTWSGSPPNSVTTNNSAALVTNDWTPGTARFYDIAGAHIIETITAYSKPADGPYVEIHTLAPLTLTSYNATFYAGYDGQIWQSICDGKATSTNFTINFCATNVTSAKEVLHALHQMDIVTVGEFLGGENFTTCAALGSNATAHSNATAVASGGAMGSATATSSPATYTGAAVGRANSAAAAVAIAAFVALW